MFALIFKAPFTLVADWQRIGGGQSGAGSHTGWIGRWVSGGAIGQITLYQRESCRQRCGSTAALSVGC